MTKLSFWHKVVFIANLCWLTTWAMKYFTLMPNGAVQSSIIVTGIIVATGLNLLVNLITGFHFIRGTLRSAPPRWLMLINFIFLIPQLYLFSR